MARPCIFISSTFYDLRHVRADIEAFVQDMGYDAVANERGDIPYGNEAALEEYCYKEIENCDIVISIVGGRFGSASQEESHSVSQMEVKQALKIGRQLYMFVDADVLAELKTFKLNPQNKDIRYAHADDRRIFEFLDEVERMKRNNTIFAFRESSEIIDVLREQWAGLFQRMLRTTSRQEEVRVIESLKSTAQSLDELVKYMASKTDRNDKIVAEILLPSHPVFGAMSRRLDVSYRVYFQNVEEMKRWLSARTFKEAAAESDDDWLVFVKKEVDYVKEKGGLQKYEIVNTLRVSASLFSDKGDLRIITDANWKDDWLDLKTRRIKIKMAAPQFDDEIPF